ncbi:MAG: hypothetical protein IKO91_00990 [Oscillospiraceae bacterium]|nr:hypothetical protein [Oscillospiraceae bacterium]
MMKLMRAQLYAMLRSRFCLLFLAAALLLSAALFFDNGDVVGSVRELEEKAELMGFEGMRRLERAEEAESIDEVMAILRVRQVIAAPAIASTNGMLMFLFLLPGITLAPALTRTSGIRQDLRLYRRVKPLLSRMVLSATFCLLLSSAIYLVFLRYYTDWRAAPPGLLGRNYLILELYILACVGYVYFVYVLLRKTWLAAPAMLLAEALLHRIVPGLYVFYPLTMLPYYTSVAYLDTTSLVAADCPPGKLIGYCAVCLAYLVICPLLSVWIFKRRDFP